MCCADTEWRKTNQSVMNATTLISALSSCIHFLQVVLGLKQSEWLLCIDPSDCQLYWLAAVAIRSRVLVQRTFLPPSLAWLGLIKAFCWNKVIIHLAISQFPHNYPPASQTLTCMNTSAPAHIRTEAQTQTHFLSDLCHYWEESG